ncbi:MAG: alpha-galactosidase [Pirellulales bacterium]|nr:alpha-galactosidase [Pirellulales bacterium]
MTVNSPVPVDGKEINDASRPESFLGENAKDILTYLGPVNVQVDKDVIALESGTKFTITNGQPVLYWRPKGQADWIESKGGKFEALEESPNRLSFRVAFGKLHANIKIEKLVGDRIWRFSGTLTNNGNEPVELARFHYFTGTVPSGVKFLELAGPREQPLLRSGQASIATRADVEQLWKSMGVFWPRLAEPIHDQPGWFVSSDIAALIEKWNAPGWGFGFVGPGGAFGEIGYRGLPDGPQVFLAVLLDNIVLDPQETRTLENAIVWCGDWQAGLDVWAGICAAQCNVKKPGPPLVGYCSWYQKATAVSPDDIEKATREFAKWPIPPGRRTIQIDDGFQIEPGNWTPNERFKTAWPGLAKRIEATGSVPGLWLAPTTVHENNPIVQQHPDWLQRLPSGEPAIYFSNWGRTYYLDPDHPQVREYIRGLLKRFCAEGWKYFKLDFTYPVTAARVPYDRKKTEFQTLRDLYVLFREAVGHDVLINACVSVPFRYAIGQVDVARLGGDIGFNYDTMRNAVRQTLTRTAANGIWLNGDPDVFAMRSENSNLSTEEKRILTGTIGLFGGSFLTSDFASQWTPDEAAFVRRFWNDRGPQPPKSQYVVWSADGDVIAYRVSYGNVHQPAHRIAVYNWSDEARTVRVRLADAHLRNTAKFRLAENHASNATLKDEILTISDQPAHSIRIVDLVENN